MIGHATFHTYELVIPIFVVLWLDTFSVSPATLGLVVGAGYALIGVGALPAGVLSDAYRSRTLVIACLLGMAAGFALLGIAPNLLVLGVGLLVWGAAASVYHPAGLSLISRGPKSAGPPSPTTARRATSASRSARSSGRSCSRSSPGAPSPSCS